MISNETYNILNQLRSKSVCSSFYNPYTLHHLEYNRYIKVFVVDNKKLIKLTITAYIALLRYLKENYNGS